MKKINTRGWSTPMIIGAGIFVAITGLLMFFVTEEPFKFAHEVVGIGFTVAIVLHILSNWRPFVRYFSKRVAVCVIALGWVIGISLVVRTAVLDVGEPDGRVVEQIEQTSIHLLAPVIGLEVNELVEQLNDEGFVVDNPQMTIEQLADKHTIETDTILLKIFR